MKKLLLLFLSLTILTAQAKNAKIDALLAKLSKSSLRSGSSVWPLIELPADAPVEQVLDRLQTSSHLSLGAYQIIATQRAEMVPDHVRVLPDGTPEKPAIREWITAVLVDTERGQKIVLMHFDGPKSWWTSVYDAP